MADGTLIFDTKLDTNGLTTGLGKIGDVAGTAFKGAAVAVGAATTAVGALAKSALDGYANFEQLAGGVETLFKESSDAVMQYAANAYQTAGLSANAYMETVTSFSASLISSLDGDTAEAARIADKAITDMSDNANKMGTDIGLIQNAYQGFAKGNYTMLDNLKLGYGGTKEEMQRLLTEAEKISGIKYDISSFADVADAIHVIQANMEISGISYEEAMARVVSGELTLEQATELMGTTAREAATTIEGSVNSMKAAWQNLVVGIADDNADLDGLINQFVGSVVTAGNNILPRIEIILNGIGQLIQTMLPVIMDMLPGIITGVLPKLLDAGVAMIDSLITGITENLGSLITLALDIVTQLANVIVSNLPLVIEAGLQIIVQLALGIASALPELIPTIVDTMLTIVDTLIANVEMLVEAAIAIIVALAEGLINALPQLISRVPQIVDRLVMALANNAPKLLQAGLTLILTLAGALITYLPQLLSKIPQIVSSLVNGFNTAVSNFKSVGSNIVQGIWSGISSGWDWLKSKVSSLAGDLFNSAKKALGIASPSKKFKWIGEMCVAGFDEGIEDLASGDAITRGVNASLGTISANTSSAGGSFGGFNQTINIHKEISTPDELARTVRLESKYGLMRGVSFAHG